MAAAGAVGMGRGTARAEGLDLFQAAAAGDMKRATELLTADPHLTRTRSEDGRTALHYAVSAGKLEMVFFLTTKGSELSAGPETPLIAAVDYPEHGLAWDMSQFLLANASDPNARRKDGKTALELAQARGYRDVVEMLIHRGAASDDRQIERAHYKRRYIQDVHGKPVKRDDTNGLSWTEINPFVSVAHANFDKVKELLTANPALLNTRASWDELAIEAASHTGRFPMAEWLAEKGAFVSTCTAVLLGQSAMVKEAIAADKLVVNERGAHDISILGYTAYAKEQAEIAGMLLKAGANVHGRALGVTALHLAASKGYTDLAEVLIAHGADVNLSLKMGGQMVTPLALAAKAEQAKMAELLKSKGAN
jgi:uncharacterized protein